MSAKFLKKGIKKVKKISQWWPSIIDSSPFAAIGPLLLHNEANLAEGFRCEAFQNTAGARIKAERPIAVKKSAFIYFKHSTRIVLYSLNIFYFWNNQFKAITLNINNSPFLFCVVNFKIRKTLLKLHENHEIIEFTLNYLLDVSINKDLVCFLVSNKK